MKLSQADVSAVARFLPRPLKDILKKNEDAFLAGGFIRATIAREQPNDVDLFVPSRERAEQLRDDIVAAAEGFTPRVHVTDNAITIMGFRLPIQIIHRWTFDSPEQGILSFDFTVAMAAVYFRDGKPDGVCSERFYEDLAAKRLRYTSPIRDEAAGGSMLRVLKFASRGYHIPLDSLAAVISRLTCKISWERPGIHDTADEQDFAAKIITGLLVEVDPNAFIEHE